MIALGSRLKSGLLASTVSLGCLAFGTTALAQENPVSLPADAADDATQAQGFGEGIVVTARRREEALGVFVNNLTKKDYILGGIGLYGGVLGYNAANYGEPRMYGLQVSYRFGG